MTAAEPSEHPLNRRTAEVEIVVPVYNEEESLDSSVRCLHRYLTERFPFSWLITIADNASTDCTWSRASALADDLDGVRAIHLDQKGRGRALHAAWSASEASVVAYMDVDLSTDLDALLPLVAPLISGHSDLAIGSRLAPGARVVRGPKREFISRAYNLILRTTLRSGFTDAQCGFKAIRTDVARRLLPLVEDKGWFFDTELLVLAERNGMRIHEVPVDWIDDPDTRVDIVSTARADLKGVGRLLAELARGHAQLRSQPDGRRRTGSSGAAQPIHFASVGLATTATFAVLFCLLYGALGAVAADVSALVLASIANLIANRRYTFGSATTASYYRKGVWLSALPIAATGAVLGALVAAGWSALPVDLTVAMAVNLMCTALRFRILASAASEPSDPIEMEAS